ANVNVYVMVEAVLLLLCKIEPPTVLYWPLKLTPVVRWITIVTVSDVSRAELASLTCSSLKNGPLEATTGVVVAIGVPLGVGVGVGVLVGVGVGVWDGVGVGPPPNWATWALNPAPNAVGVPSYAVIRLGPLEQLKSAFHAQPR